MCQGLTKNRVILLLKSYAIALITVESAGKALSTAACNQGKRINTMLSCLCVKTTDNRNNIYCD